MELPITLNTPGFLQDSGFMHVQDRFVSRGNATMQLNLRRRSVLRIAGEHGTTFNLHTRATGMVTPFSDNLVHVLEPGMYEIGVIPAFLDVEAHCLYVEMEAAIEPVEAISQTPCQSSPPQSLPQLASISVPFHFGPTHSSPAYPTFVAYPYSGASTRIAQYTLYVSEAAILYTAVSSSFLYHSATVTLWRPGRDSLYEVARAELLYNFQYIIQLLMPGNYYVTIDVPPFVGRPEVLPRCLPFNFELHLSPYTVDSYCELFGEPAPLSFNNYRFLNPTGRMDFADVDFRIPTNFSLRDTQPIPFTLTQRSLFRAYTEPNTAVDIDIRVTDATGRVIATGSNSIFTEEAIDVMLEPGEYRFVLIYWIWDSSLLPQCPTFHMQVAVEPSLMTDPCESGSDHWPPPLPSVIQKPYRYSSTDLDEDLWF
jgi:hypothetical protein